MVSAVEQMAANTSWSVLGKAKDLRNRILFTLGLLCVYRLGTFIPVPGIDGAAFGNSWSKLKPALAECFRCLRAALWVEMGIFALGIMPYISASIIVQLLTSMVPSRAVEKRRRTGSKKN